MRTLARTISFGGVTLGTGTVADSTGYRYALGTAGTLLALRATNQHALAIDDRSCKVVGIGTRCCCILQ